MDNAHLMLNWTNNGCELTRNNGVIYFYAQPHSMPNYNFANIISSRQIVIGPLDPRRGPTTSSPSPTTAEADVLSVINNNTEFLAIRNLVCIHVHNYYFLHKSLHVHITLHGTTAVATQKNFSVVHILQSIQIFSISVHNAHAFSMH